MTCDRTEQAHAYHDGQLNPAARAEFERHVAGCAPCAQLLRELRSVSRLIATAPLPDVPFANERYYEAWHVSRQRGLLRISSWLTAAAAAVLVGSLVLFPDSPDAPRGKTVAQDTGEWEAVAIMPPPERGSDRPDQFVELAQWIAEDLSIEGVR